jgi:hypothetical protein
MRQRRRLLLARQGAVVEDQVHAVTGDAGLRHGLVRGPHHQVEWIRRTTGADAFDSQFREHATSEHRPDFRQRRRHAVAFTVEDRRRRLDVRRQAICRAGEPDRHDRLFPTSRAPC